LQRLFKQYLRRFEIAGLLGQLAQEIIRIRMARIKLEYLVVEMFSLSYHAPKMQGNSLLQQTLD
jgi:hypothetical protein